MNLLILLYFPFGDADKVHNYKALVSSLQEFFLQIISPQILVYVARRNQEALLTL